MAPGRGGRTFFFSSYSYDSTEQESGTGTIHRPASRPARERR